MSWSFVFNTWPPDEDDGDPELARTFCRLADRHPLRYRTMQAAGFRALKMSDVLT
jgi:hypothetical protein